VVVLSVKVESRVLAAAVAERGFERLIGSLKRFVPCPSDGSSARAPAGPEFSRRLLTLARSEEG
jgi:hypothetical protein